MKRHEFDAAYARICDVCGAKTQMKISLCLGISQSSISEARRRVAIPAAWLLTILAREGANPAWLLTGEGSKYLVPSSLPPTASTVLMARLAGPDLEQRIRAGLMSATECLAAEIRELAGIGRKEAEYD